MNRTDRLLAIILELQRHRVQRAEDLAATFETSKRTIYRDLEALAESGVPLVAVPGQGYSLVEGYFLPPVSFTADEATMLLLGADVMAASFDAQYSAVARSAGGKIEGVLTESRRVEVDRLRAGLRFVTTTQTGNPDTLAHLQALRRAIMECRRVCFRYHARYAAQGASGSGMQAEAREIDPHGLAYVDRAWYLNGFDHLRGEIRRFRLDRMESLSILSTSFDRPSADVETQATRPNDRTVQVMALFTPKVARWVRESPSYFAVEMRDTDAGLLVRFTIRHFDELTNYLLGWGRQVTVLEPAELRRQLADEIAAMARNYSSES